jgi:methylase of polypeptide subunit release factors
MRRVRENPDQRILEIGVGGFALIAGSLSRVSAHPVDAVEIDPGRGHSSRRHAELNGVRVNVFESDLLTALPPNRYDLLFWNLPYYRDASVYLAGLLRQVGEYMTDRAELIVGYNSKALSRQTVLDLVAAKPHLGVAETHTWSWNLHEVLVLRLHPRRRST